LSQVSVALAEAGNAFYDNWLVKLKKDLRAALASCWPMWAHEGQRAPKGNWRVWLMMAGRGYGKTRAGAEWVSEIARAGNEETRIALVAATMDEARSVMVEGESGILSVGPVYDRPHWEPSRARLVWRSGAQALLFSGANPDGLRGPQHHFAWCDEVAKWSFASAAWDNLNMALRLGGQPRALVTTTPRAMDLLRRMLAGRDVVVTGGRTTDNLSLPPSFVSAVTATYAGTRLGRQELDGELIDDIDGALWTRAMIEGARVADVPDFARVVVAVDPPASATGDACGIVAVALGRDGHGYVIEDASVAGASPERWASAVAACAERHGADRIVAEANNGGDMVTAVLRAADQRLPVRLVHASHGKSARAEPVAALYERGRVHHIRAFPALEDELCGMVRGGGYEGPGNSPDRADACVWALTELMLGKRRAEPSVRGL